MAGQRPRDDAACVHEFGHALGLIHEHQNPNRAIQWNRDAVINDLQGPPNNWDLKQSRTMFRFQIQLSSQLAGGRRVDRDVSIPLPDRTVHFLNTDLTETDKQIAGRRIRSRKDLATRIHAAMAADDTNRHGIKDILARCFTGDPATLF
jgi:hypothetical protein